MLIDDLSPGGLLFDDPAQVVGPHDLATDVEHGGQLVGVPVTLQVLRHLHLHHLQHHLHLMHLLHLHHLQHGVALVDILPQELGDVVRGLESL